MKRKLSLYLVVLISVVTALSTSVLLIIRSAELNESQKRRDDCIISYDRLLKMAQKLEEEAQKLERENYELAVKLKKAKSKIPEN